MLIYLNKNWEDSYGGEFELWDKKMKNCVKRIPPNFNNVALFSTTSDSYHGHPNPLKCPKSRSRKSIALYYYTNGRPENEKISFLEDHSTIFRARKTEKSKNKIEEYFKYKKKKERTKQIINKFIITIKLILPPIIIIFIKNKT